MVYSFKSRVRFSEIGEDRKMSLNSILNYYQDCSNLHSRKRWDSGFSSGGEKRAWMLSSWQICVNRYPVMGEPLVVSTWAYDFKGFYEVSEFSAEDRRRRAVILCQFPVDLYRYRVGKSGQDRFGGGRRVCDRRKVPDGICAA